MRGGVSHHETPPRFMLKKQEICRRIIADNAVGKRRKMLSDYKNFYRRTVAHYAVEKQQKSATDKIGRAA